MKTYLIYLLIFTSFQLSAQSKLYKLDSITYKSNFPGAYFRTKTDYTYRSDDSLESITDYRFDSTKMKYVPTSKTNYYDINLISYFLVRYNWDTLQKKYQLVDSFKIIKSVYSTISYDSTFAWKANRWQIDFVQTFWHHPTFYSTLKLYDSIQWFDFKVNTSAKKFYWRYDSYGRDTLYTEQDFLINSKTLYRKVYDDSSRLKEKYYAENSGKYFLKETLYYDSKSNLIRLDYINGLNTNSPKTGSYKPFSYQPDIKLKDCIFYYQNEYFGQPFKNVPTEEYFPWDSTGIHYEKRLFYISKTKLGSSIELVRPSKISLYPNPSKGSLKHSSPEPLRLLFCSLDGRKIEEVILEPTMEYKLKNTSYKIYLVEAFDSKGERLFVEKLVLE